MAFTDLAVDFGLVHVGREDLVGNLKKATQEVCRGATRGAPVTLGIWAITQKAARAYRLPTHAQSEETSCA